NKREREGDYAAGKKTGTWNEYAGDKLVFTGNYSDGKPNGDFVYYDRRGKELGRFTIKNGTGTMLTFHYNRKPATRTRMSNGLLNSTYEELTTAGKLVVQGAYVQD